MDLVVASAGHGWALAVFPLIASALAAVFGAMLARQFAERHRPFQGMWAVALFMFAGGSFAMFLGVAYGWTSGEFRWYWLLGAVLNVPYLTMGELYLLIRRAPVAHAILGLTLIGTAFATWKVLGAPIHEVALAKSLPLGKQVFGDSSTPYRIAQLYAFPAYFLLLGGIAWSAWQMKGRPELVNRTAGTIAVALGATIVAIGSGVGAGLNVVPLFSVSLAVGIAVMFAGFIRASKPARGKATYGTRSPPSA